MSVFDACQDHSMNTPVEYMEYQLLKKQRMNQQRSRKGRIDIMTAARNSIYDDFKHYANVNLSDNEQKLEKDEDYLNMSLLKTKYNAKRRDSDQSVNTNYNR